MSETALLFPLFLKLEGRRVVLVGGGKVAAAKLQSLRGTGASILVIAPEVRDELFQAGVGAVIVRRAFEPRDLDGAWLVIAAATPEVNRAVAAAAAERHLFVNAVDDPRSASAYACGVVRRAGVAIGISTAGLAPALAGLLREALDAVLPHDLHRWVSEARAVRAAHKTIAVPMHERRPLLLRALNALYSRRGARGRSAA